MLTWDDIVDWRSGPVYAEADSWKSQFDKDHQLADDLDGQISHITSQGDTADAARAALRVQLVAANEQVNFAGGMQLAYHWFAEGIDRVSGLVADAYDIARDNWCEIGSYGKVCPDYDIPFPATTLSPEEYALARSKAVGQAITNALDTANQYDQLFNNALSNVNFENSVVDPNTGKPDSGYNVPLDPSVAADDPLTPGENCQGNYGDCWFLSLINAMMETPTGQQQLRDGVRWDASLPGYMVRIYDHGKEVWVPVRSTLPDGVAIMAGGSSGPDISSLYEAAVTQYFGTKFVNSGESISTGSNILTNEPTRSYIQWPFNTSTADDAIRSGGSVSGIPVIAVSPSAFFCPGGPSSIPVAATSNPTSGITESVEILANHAYEVVDIKNGMIGLRNPWGPGNPVDGNAQNSAGVFYVDQMTYDMVFPKLSIGP